MTSGAVDPHILVILGGTGDLARRKLIPSLYDLGVEFAELSGSVILGVGSSDLTDDDYRAMVVDALADSGLDNDEVSKWCSDCVFYQRISRNDPDYGDLSRRIGGLEEDLELPGNRAFYLALPPQAVPTAIEQLGAHGLNDSEGWVRVVIEKPFGHDLESAVTLNTLVHDHFTEDQVYRIDHYLGKETVQNLLVFRFANVLFERAWNRDSVASVQITVAESLGVEGRAGYYDASGAVRDMVQSHLTQLLTLVAMEPPVRLAADDIRDEKVKVLRAMDAVTAEAASLGQYAAGVIDGELVPAYVDDPEVPPGSSTPTAAAAEVFVDTWRWQGVPFLLRTGKRLPTRATEIVVTFKPAPVSLFEKPDGTAETTPDVLTIRLQPDEGFELLFDIKEPGEPLHIRSLPLSFRYGSSFAKLPDAYQTLILDVLEGDQTLFVRADEVEESWRVWEPLLAAGIPIEHYPAGTWPQGSNAMARRTGTEWRMPSEDKTG